MKTDFKWRHYRGEVILWAVRWYCRYGISYRELEEMLCERGVDVDHTTIYRWFQHYAPEMERRLRWQYRSRSFAGSWRVPSRDICCANTLPVNGQGGGLWAGDP